MAPTVAATRTGKQRTHRVGHGGGGCAGSAVCLRGRIGAGEHAAQARHGGPGEQSSVAERSRAATSRNPVKLGGTCESRAAGLGKQTGQEADGPRAGRGRVLEGKGGLATWTGPETASACGCEAEEEDGMKPAPSCQSCFVSTYTPCSRCCAAAAAATATVAATLYAYPGRRRAANVHVRVHVRPARGHSDAACRGPGFRPLQVGRPARTVHPHAPYRYLPQAPRRVPRPRAK